MFPLLHLSSYCAVPRGLERTGTVGKSLISIRLRCLWKDEGEEPAARLTADCTQTHTPPGEPRLFIQTGQSVEPPGPCGSLRMIWAELVARGDERALAGNHENRVSDSDTAIKDGQMAHEPCTNLKTTLFSISNTFSRDIFFKSSKCKSLAPLKQARFPPCAVPLKLSGPRSPTICRCVYTHTAAELL